MYEQYLEPIAKVYENILILPSHLDYGGYYKIEYIEPLPEQVVQGATAAPAGFGATLAAGAASPRVPNNTGTSVFRNLNMLDGNLAIYEIELLDDFQLLIWQPAADGRFAGQNASWYISQQTEEPQLRRIAIYEDKPIAFQAVNPQSVTISSMRMNFKGWRYKLTKLVEVPKAFAGVFTEVQK